MPELRSQSPGVLRVLQFTDLHLFGAEGGRLAGVDTEASFRACLEYARQHHWPPDLVLLTGDLSHDPSPAAYDRLQRLLQGLGCPACALPGNHDERGLLRGLLLDGEPLSRRSLVSADWQFVLLDTTIEGSDAGRLSEAELAHLQGCLAQAGDRHTLVCMHHAPVALHSRWLDRMRLANADALFAILARHPRPGGVLWGHIHQDYDAAVDGWRLLATPSTCVQFAPGSDDFTLDCRPPGYRWLRLHSDGRIDTAVVRLPALPPGFNPAAPY